MTIKTDFWKDCKKLAVKQNKGEEIMRKIIFAVMALLMCIAAENSVRAEECCIYATDSLSMEIPCAEYDGHKYSFRLDYFPNPKDPERMYWKMDIGTFKEISAGWEPSRVSDFPGYDYEKGILTIPRVDTPEQSGMFQDARMELTGEGHWLLTGLKTAGTSPFASPTVQKVEVIVTETFPVQVFLKVGGFLKDITFRVGKITQRLKGNHFEIFMYSEDRTPESNDTTLIIPGFEEVIPLSVYDLSAGTYEYSLNGVFPSYDDPALTGTFVLTRDNRF
jgi:hypothetical protein